MITGGSDNLSGRGPRILKPVVIASFREATNIGTLVAGWAIAKIGSCHTGLLHLFLEQIIPRSDHLWCVAVASSLERPGESTHSVQSRESPRVHATPAHVPCWPRAQRHSGVGEHLQARGKNYG